MQKNYFGKIIIPFLDVLIFRREKYTQKHRDTGVGEVQMNFHVEEEANSCLRAVCLVFRLKESVDKTYNYKQPHFVQRKVCGAPKLFTYEYK